MFLLHSAAGILIGVSFSKLEPNEVGLDYSANSLTIDTGQLYQSGVTFLGVGHSFIKFPTVRARSRALCRALAAA
jgi:hypothetical protein